MLHLTTAAVLSLSAVAMGEPPIRTLLITGHNNHNWRYTSRLHHDTLEWTGRFEVDVTDTPESTLPQAAAKYQLFVLDYNDFGNPKRWGEAAERAFIEAVRQGAGVVAIHSANNAFKGWAEYEAMLGLMWRDGTGHGDFHTFNITFTDREHPITRGLPDIMDHPDELYHGLVNSQNVKVHVLAEAFDDPKIRGRGGHEPMALTLTYGEGRIFATPLGHVWVGNEANKPSISDPQFKILLCRGAEWAATGKVTLGTTWTDAVDHNTLTPEERAEGWTLLFDGKTTNNFRGYKTNSFPDNWIVENGTLRRPPGKAGPDLVTTEQFGDFELSCQFRVAPGGNSGIIYRATEDHSYAWETGPEYQVLDNLAHKEARPVNKCGALYDVFPSTLDVARPGGEWNHARIVVKGTRVEHWLNGYKIVEVDLGSPEAKEAIAGSKWAQYPDFGSRPRGHIAFQDHGDEVQYRAIKVRRLD